MVALDLSTEEIEALRRLLETAVSELGSEIADTDRVTLRRALKHDKEVALKVLALLPAAAADSPS